jgi:hypothetical protein
MDFDYIVRPTISPDGRTIGLPSLYNTYFVDPISMDLVTQVETKSASYAKMTDRHIFIKHNGLEEGWTIISFKETRISTNYKSECIVEKTD